MLLSLNRKGYQNLVKINSDAAINGFYYRPRTDMEALEQWHEGFRAHRERCGGLALRSRPQDWRWSSIHAHLKSSEDNLVTVKPMLDRFPDWAAYLGDHQSDQMLQRVRKHTRTGRPLGSVRFIETLEALSGRPLKMLKPGRKPIR